MIRIFPWALLFFFLMFCGIFMLVLYYTKMQDRAIQDLLRQQRAIRMELERLSAALDALLADRPLSDDEPDLTGAAQPEAIPGLDRLLLGPDAGTAAKSAPQIAPAGSSASAADSGAGLPDLKL